LPKATLSIGFELLLFLSTIFGHNGRLTALPNTLVTSHLPLTQPLANVSQLFHERIVLLVCVFVNATVCLYLTVYSRRSPSKQSKMAFTFTAMTYIIALIMDAFLIFFSVFHVIAFDELKTDFKNPIDQCKTLNPLVLPEYLIHLAFNVLFLFCGEWFTLLLNVPLIAYHVHRYINRPVMSSPGLYDPTSIMNADQLSRATREGWAKLGFYLLSFFYYLYGMIYSLIQV